MDKETIFGEHVASASRAVSQYLKMSPAVFLSKKLHQLGVGGKGSGKTPIELIWEKGSKGRDKVLAMIGAMTGSFQ